MTLNPHFGPNGARFPPLPKFRNSWIEQQVFTHRSLYARPTHIFEDHPDDPSPDNEKFEHLGDTALGLVVTSLMLEMYPGLRVGPSTKIRALIVGNATLASISVKYRLPERLRVHPAQALTLRASTNIQADVFESFVGGLFIDQGLEAVQAWLVPLFRPYVTEAYLIVKQQHGLPPALPTPMSSPHLPPAAPPASIPITDGIPPATIGHLALFNQNLQKANRQVEWVYSDGSSDQRRRSHTSGSISHKGAALGPVGKVSKTTPIWSVKVLVDGEFYGQGKGSTKKAARNEAAKEGLERLGVHVCLDDLDPSLLLEFDDEDVDAVEESASKSSVQQMEGGEASLLEVQGNESQHHFSRLEPDELQRTAGSGVQRSWVGPTDQSSNSSSRSRSFCSAAVTCSLNSSYSVTTSYSPFRFSATLSPRSLPSCEAFFIGKRRNGTYASASVPFYWARRIRPLRRLG